MTGLCEQLRRARAVHAALAIVVLAWGIGWALSALAHQAPSGWEYSTDCCSARDCAPVPDTAVREAPGGWSVLIMPGEHPMVPSDGAPVSAHIRHGDDRIRMSGDGEKHACVGFTRRVLCVYLPAVVT